MTDGAWLAVLAAALLCGILSGAPVMLAISGIPVLVALIASLFGAFDLTFLQAFPQRVLGIMNNSIFVAVPLFVAMGVLLERSRAAERMLVSLAGLLGGSASMLVVSVLLVSTLIAASTGIIGATIVMLGMIALPALMRGGLSPTLSSGVICAAGTLGQIIPPSIVLVLLGDQISNAHIEAQRNLGNFAPDPVTVSDLFAGALLPGLVLVALYAAYALVAVRLWGPAKAAAIDTARHVPALSLSAAAMDLVPPILLIVAVLGSILFGIATPTEAAAVGVAGTLLLAAARDRDTSRRSAAICAAAAVAAFGLVALRAAGIAHQSNGIAVVLALLLFAGLVLAAFELWRSGVLPGVVAETVQVSAMIFGIVIAASMLSLVFRGFEGDTIIHAYLSHLPGEKWGMLATTMVVIFLLGFVLEFVEIVFIVIPIVGPILLATDIDPVWFAILVALNLQTSFLTPPFGFALFYFRSVAPPSLSTLTIYRSILPFVIIQIAAIGIVVLFPGLATWLPTVLFRGN
jgi:tripartite ATP-independent transporter DctM subunit